MTISWERREVQTLKEGDRIFIGAFAYTVTKIEIQPSGSWEITIDTGHWEFLRPTDHIRVVTKED